MKIVREPQILSGFLYEEPLPDWPALTHCGEAVCEAGLRLKTHKHRGFELLYLSRGECTWQIDGGMPYQGMGDLFIAFPDQSHALAPVPHSELSVLWVGIALDQFDDEAQRLAARLRAARRHVIRQCHELEPLLRGIVSQVTSARTHRVRAVQAYLQTIDQLLHQRLDAATGDSKSVAPYSYTIQKAVGYLHSDLDRRIPLAEIADAVGCGLSQLCHRFKTEVGCSPAEYHLRLRLTTARDALGSQNATVTATAYQYGFSSSQHFSAAFRELFGVSPQRWRERLRNRAKRA